MEKNITIFSNPQFGQIRTMTDRKGEPWFCGIDVAHALGYKQEAKAVREHVDEEDKGVSVLDTPGGIQKATFINESGLYSLILSSKLDTAKQFKRWVTSEVLPTIRKHGSYALHGGQFIPLNKEELVRQAFIVLNIQAKELTEKNQQLTEKVEELEPDAKYCRECLQSINCLTTTQVAKSINMTALELYSRLLSLGILYRQSGQYMPYAKYARMGLTSTRTQNIPRSNGQVITTTYLVWTQNGARFLRDLFRQQVIPFFAEDIARA